MSSDSESGAHQTRKEANVKAIKYGTEVVVRLGVIVGSIVALGIWMNGRLEAVERAQIETGVEKRQLIEGIRDLKDDIKNINTKIDAMRDRAPK